MNWYKKAQLTEYQELGFEEPPMGLHYTDIGHNPDLDRTMWYIDKDYQFHETKPKVGYTHDWWFGDAGDAYNIVASGRHEQEDEMEVVAITFFWGKFGKNKIDAKRVSRILQKRWPNAAMWVFGGY